MLETNAMTGTCCCCAMIAAGLIGAAAGADERGGGGAVVTVKITIAVNGGEPVIAEPTLTEASPGNYKLATLINDPGGAWSALINYNADTNVEGNAQLTGFMEFTNKTGLLLDTVYQFDLPLCPFALDAAAIGGTTTVKLTMGADGGSVTCPAADALWMARVDGQGEKSLFDGPFELKGSGKGTAVTTYEFGTPMPGFKIDHGAQDFGLRHRFSLTGNDKVRLTSLYLLGAPQEDILDCNVLSPLPGDLDGDGVVGSHDLGLLLALWGSGDPAADINHDGVVGGDDLGALLVVWNEG